MVNVEEVECYQCDGCDELYDMKIEADNCCPRDSIEITGFKCGRCGCLYEYDDDASECCEDKKSDKK